MPAKILRTRKASPKKTSRVIEPIDPDEDFSDVSGDPGSLFDLVNNDPTRKYSWAHQSKDCMQEMATAVVPYVVETYTKGGVMPRGGEILGLQEGEPITVKDHTLMSCDRVRWEKRERYLRNKTEIQNRQLAKARQSDTNLEDENWRREAAGLNYRE